MQDTRCKIQVPPPPPCILYLDGWQWWVHLVSGLEWGGGSIGIGGQKLGGPSWEIRERPGPEPHVEAARRSLNRQHFEDQLLGQPLSEIDDHDSMARKHPQKWAAECAERELDSGPRHWDADQRTELAHPEPDMAVTQSDLRQLETDAGRNALPHHRHLCGQRIALTLEREVPEIVAGRQQLVEMPLDQPEIEGQVEPIPTGKRGRQKIFHDRKYRGGYCYRDCFGRGRGLGLGRGV